jgi:hypothetical protein
VNDEPPTDVLIFKLSDDGKLLAIFEACECKPPLDKAIIKDALAKQGLSSLFLYENSLLDLIKKYSDANEGFVLKNR